MRKIVLPLIIFAAGLFIAGALFDIDIEKLFQGAWQLIKRIVSGG